MPPRKRPTTYPPAVTSKRPIVPREARPERAAATSIDVDARKGQTGLSVGDRVRIAASGLYSGEMAVVVGFAGTAIPTAVVKTDAGNTRQVRTIDLEPAGSEQQ